MSHVSAQQEAEIIPSAPTVDESKWRQELEYLDRLLTGRLTEAEAKVYAKSELAKHERIVTIIETELSQARAVAAAATSYLSALDGKRIADKIEDLEFQLENARKLHQRSIRQNGAAIRDGKEADKHRPRWVELKKRERDIEAARSIGRNKHGSEIAIGMPRKW
jgi:hypothetical protein